MGVYISSQLIKDGSVEGKDLKDATITESKLDAALAAKVNATGATVSANVTAANEAADTTCFPLFVTAPTGDLGPKTNAGLAFNSATGVLTATGLSGPLTGNVTGNTSGSSGSCTGNAATVTNGVYTTGAGTVFLAPTGSAAGLTGFPTLNQSTSGNAATATNLAGTATANTVYGGPATGAAAAPGFRALVAADLGTTMTPTFGGITTGTETTVANKNKYLPLISDSAGIQLRHQTYYWNGSSYAATDGYGFGNSALQNNTGDSCSGFGINALFGNAGSLSNGFGYNALYTNTGAGCNGFGYYALFGNTGTNCNGFGSDALNSNTGSYCNGFGVSALSNNTGAFSNGFGYAALSNNTGTNCNGFGTNALSNNIGALSNGFGTNALNSNTGALSNGFGSNTLVNNNWANALAIGYQAGFAFTANAATAKTFAYADVSGAAHTITVAGGHGFGSSGKINLLFTLTAGTAPAGLATATVYQFTVTSTTVLTLAAITSAGSADFTGKLENSIDTTNTIVLGTGANATKANQIVLGPDSITETVLRGALALTIGSIGNYADDAAAAAGGVAVGTVYRTGSIIKVRVA